SDFMLRFFYVYYIFLIIVFIYNYFLYFFFFQAEDGIRDRNVTGVQTCALPISLGSESKAWSPAKPLPTTPMTITAIAQSTSIKPSLCLKPWLSLPANPPRPWASPRKPAPSNRGSLPTSSLSTAISSPATSKTSTTLKS